MLARIGDKNIVRLYVVTLLLAIAYGAAVALVALQLDEHGFHEAAIGRLAVFFAAGIVLFSIPAGVMIRSLGAKAVLVAALLTYAVTVTVFPLLTTFATLAFVRFFDGASSACIWVSCETILLERADPRHKAFVTSLYAVAVAIGYVLGPLLVKVVLLAFPMKAGFFTSGVLATASALYAALALDRDPPAPLPGDEAKGRDHATVVRLLSLIKTSAFATFTYGYFQASVVLFLPLFLVKNRGVAPEHTVLVPAFFAGGMLLFSNVAGRVGDRLGHLRVMRVLAAIGLTMVVGFAYLPSFPLMLVAVFVAGATLASISPVSLALQGIVTPAPDYARGNAIYNAFYAMGILLGPLVTSVIFVRWGGVAMLVSLAALWAAFVIFSLVFAGDDPASHRAVLETPGAPPRA